MSTPLNKPLTNALQFLLLAFTINFSMASELHTFLKNESTNPEPRVKSNFSRRVKGPDLFLINSDNIDRISIGDAMQDVLALFPPSRTQHVLIYDAERSYEKVEVLDKSSEVLLSIDPTFDKEDSIFKVERITVKGGPYHTRSSIKVGSFYIDLVRSGETVTDLSWFEGNLVAKAASGVNFVLQTSFIPRPWYKTMDKTILPDNTKIIGIMINGSEGE